MEGVRLDHLAQYLGEVCDEWQAPTPGPGVEQAVRLGGPGTPAVPEFAVCEVATALGLTQPAATGLCADVLDLAYRLRRIAGAVRCGQLSFARARLIARRTRDLPAEQVGLVEERLCARRDSGAGPVPMAALVPMSRLRSVTDQAVLTVRGPESAAEAEERVASSLYVRISQAEPGAADVMGRLAVADAVRLDCRLDQVAGWLQQVGDRRPKPILRAVALGLLADPDLLRALEDLRRQRSIRETDGGAAPRGDRTEKRGSAGGAGAAPSAGGSGNTRGSGSAGGSGSLVDAVSAVSAAEGGALAEHQQEAERPREPERPRGAEHPGQVEHLRESEHQHDAGQAHDGRDATRTRGPGSSRLADGAKGADPDPLVDRLVDRGELPESTPAPRQTAPGAEPPPNPPSNWQPPPDDAEHESSLSDPLWPPGDPDLQRDAAASGAPTCTGEPCWAAGRGKSSGPALPSRPVRPGDPVLPGDPDAASDLRGATDPGVPPESRVPGAASDRVAGSTAELAGVAGCPPAVLKKFANISSTVLYLHLDQTSQTWCEERGGALTAQQARALVGHSRVSVRPVLDLAEPLSYTGYVAPPLLKEQLAMLNAGYCPFPYCHRRARAGDVDHQIPASMGGPTTSSNTHLPCRKHHRAKDKGGWRVVCPATGIWVWTSPAGAVYLVSNGTTTRLNGIANRRGVVAAGLATATVTAATNATVGASTGAAATNVTAATIARTAGSDETDVAPATASPGETVLSEPAPSEGRHVGPAGVKEAWTPPWDPWDDVEPLTRDEHDLTYGWLNTA